MNPTRRGFLAQGGGAALAAGLLTAGALAAEKKAERKSGKRAEKKAEPAAIKSPNKLAVRGVGMRTGGLKSSIKSLAEAKQLAFDAIEIEAGGPADVLECADAKAQKEFIAEMKNTGVAMASICMGLCNSYPVWSDPRAKDWLDQTVDATAALGAKAILVAFFGKGNLKGNDEAKAKSIEVMKSVSEHAAKKGVIFGLENTLSAEENIEMVEKIGSPFVRVYYDIGNSVGNGYDVPKELRMLGTKYICQIHFKDNPWLLGQGRLDMAEIGRAVRDIGYKEWAVLETSSPLGREASLTYNLGFVRGLLAR